MTTSTMGTPLPTFTLRRGRIPDHLIDDEFYGPKLAGRAPIGWWVSDIDLDEFEELSPGYIDPELLVPADDVVDGFIEPPMSLPLAMHEFSQIVASAVRRRTGYEFEVRVAGWVPVPGGEAEQAHVPTFVRVENVVRIVDAAGREWKFDHLSSSKVDELRSDFHANESPGGAVLTVQLSRSGRWPEEKYDHRQYFRNPAILDHEVLHHPTTLAALLAATKGQR